MKTDVITIDGPAASGKSSVARKLAQKLGLPFVSSGLLYRAATYLVLAKHVEASDGAAVFDLLQKHEVNLRLEDATNCLTIDGEDVSAQLHTGEIDRYVSAVSLHPRVRQWVFERLRDIKGGFVIEGRDMGSVVFPHAKYKFFLTANPEVRANRRLEERDSSYQEVLADIKARDQRDAKQLQAAADAIWIHTDQLSLEAVVKRIWEQLPVKQVNYD